MQLFNPHIQTFDVNLYLHEYVFLSISRANALSLFKFVNDARICHGIIFFDEIVFEGISDNIIFKISFRDHNHVLFKVKYLIFNKITVEIGVYIKRAPAIEEGSQFQIYDYKYQNRINII